MARTLLIFQFSATDLSVAARPTETLVGLCMSILGDRIAIRLKVIGKSEVDLAKAVRMSQQGINSMTTGGKVQRPRKLREIAAFLVTSQEYLLGETNDPAPPMELLYRNLVAVPVISWVSAGKLADSEEPIPEDEGRTILVDDLGAGEFFALRVDGDSMDRISPDGSIIIVNRRDQQLVSDKPYVFAVKGKSTYKLWHPPRPPEPFYLEPFSTNPKNRPVFADRKQLEVVGRVRRTILDL
jgi:SOS-response transcriptional repressor LexA